MHVVADRPADVRIALTRMENRAATTQVVSSQGSSGGSNKWLWIAIAGGGAGAALAIAKSKSNKPPVPGTVSVSPSTALQSSTVVNFTASGASDPEGDPLTFTWDFGDGATGSGQTTTHVYQTSASFSPKVTVSDGKNSASATGSVAVRSMSGTWTGSTFGGFTFTITQSGSSVTGSYRDIDGPGTTSGSVSSNNLVNLTVNQSPFAPYTYSGTVDSTLNTWTGTVLGLSFTARRQ